MKNSVSYPYIWPNSSKQEFENVFAILFILHTGIFSVYAVSLLPWVLYFSLGFRDSLIEILCSPTKAKDREFSAFSNYRKPVPTGYTMAYIKECIAYKSSLLIRRFQLNPGI